MPKYVATRKDVCAGQLIKPIGMLYKIFDKDGNDISDQGLESLGFSNFAISGGFVCRGMLFNVDDNGLANDLIYTTPTHYQIEGIQPQKEVQSDLTVEHYVELEEVLKYMKYGVDLTQRDLNQIYKRLITRSWWLRRHIELFGWKEVPELGGYINTGDSILPPCIYEQLLNISLCSDGKPSQEEPGYSYIKKKR